MAHIFEEFMKKAFYIICLFFISTLFAEEFCNGEFWYEINKNDEVIKKYIDLILERNI